MWIRTGDEQLVNLDVVGTLSIGGDDPANPELIAVYMQPFRVTTVLTANGENAGQNLAQCIEKISTAIASDKTYCDLRYAVRGEQDPVNPADIARAMGNMTGRAKSR